MFTLSELSTKDPADDNIFFTGVVRTPPRRGIHKSTMFGEVYVDDVARLTYFPWQDLHGQIRKGSRVILLPNRNPPPNYRSGRMQGVFWTDNQQQQVPTKHVPYIPRVCEFVVALALADDTEFAPSHPYLYRPTWVGADPSMAFRVADIWLQNQVLPGLDDLVAIDKDIVNPFNMIDMIFHYCVTHKDGRKRIVEVIPVVDADYATPETAPLFTKKRPVYLAENPASPDNYQRSAIFPWGMPTEKEGQNRHDSELVVSKDLNQRMSLLAKLANCKLKKKHEAYKATVLFVVLRDDVHALRPNRKSCPMFVQYLETAHASGAQVLAKRASFDPTTTNCYDDDETIPIEWPAPWEKKSQIIIA